VKKITEEKINERFWKDMIKKYWKELLLCVIVVVVLSIIAIFVGISHIQASPFGDQGEATFDEWRLDWIVGFVVVLILWELLFVGVPALIIFGIGGYLWWQKATEEEKTNLKKEEKRKHKAEGAGGIGCFTFIAYCIYMGIFGYYYTPFGSYPYSFWLLHYFYTIGWLLIIFGIPMAIGGLLYLRYWLNKP